MKFLTLSLALVLAICLTVFQTTVAVPIEIYTLPVEAAVDNTPLTLLDIENADQNVIDSDAETQRATRGLGLGLLAGKFGGGGFGHGFGGLGGFGGFGLGGFHGLGGGFGFKPFFGKHFG